MELQRLKFLMEVQEKIDEWSKKLPPEDTNLVKAKEQFFRLVTTELEKSTPKNELQESAKISQIALDTSTIRQALEIRADISINFDFIDVERVKNQLITDNLRMENPRWDLPREGVQRFHEFCVNAFYQIEELINYYLGKKTEKHTISRVLDFIEEQCVEKNEKSRKDAENKNKNLREGEKPKPPFLISFNRKNLDEKIKKNEIVDVSNIEINIKLVAFLHYFKFDYAETLIASNLRQLRNEESHRCNIILNNSLEKLYPFLVRRAENYDKIRQLIVHICESIKKDLGKKMAVK